MIRNIVTTTLFWFSLLTTANAGFLGHMVTAEWFYPAFSSTIETHNTLVDAEVELPSAIIQNDNKFDINLDDNFVLFTFNSLSRWTDTTANGWSFSDTNETIPEIFGYTIGELTGEVSGLSASDLSFTADSVFGNFRGVVAESGSTIRLDLHFAPEPTTVLVDIKPGGDKNTVSLRSKSDLSVALLSSEDFDVSNVDIDSLLFGDPLLIDGGATAVSPAGYSYKDVSHDGLLDLTLKFSIPGLVENNVLGTNSIEGLLTGNLLDGTLIEGMDSIRTVPSNNQQGELLAQVSAIPEPTTTALALVATFCLVGRRRIF